MAKQYNEFSGTPFNFTPKAVGSIRVTTSLLGRRKSRHDRRAARAL